LKSNELEIGQGEVKDVMKIQGRVREKYDFWRIA